MKRKHHEILKYIYERNEVFTRAVTEKMDRAYGDHRDFYPLAGLVLEGFLGFTGAVPAPGTTGGSLGHQDAYFISRIFQCYSQGPGYQSYQDVEVFGSERDSSLFIAAKGLLYFHERYERRKEWWAVATLGLISAIVAGCVTGVLISAK